MFAVVREGDDSKLHERTNPDLFGSHTLALVEEALRSGDCDRLER